MAFGNKEHTKNSIFVPVAMSKTDGSGANSVDPDQTPHLAASDLGLHCLPMAYTEHKYGKHINLPE